MQTEIEAKFPQIDVDLLQSKLKEIGAKLIHPEILMRRHVFDYPDYRLYQIGGWIRLRQENEKITLSYKQLNDRTLHGTKEINLTVDDYDKTYGFLTTIGFIEKSYQETKRETWIYKNVEITIDTWPWVPTFVEIEGPTEVLVKEVASDLGLDWQQAMHGSVETVYQMHYNVTDKEINSWKEVKFNPVPDWLLAKKK
ncbi:MAG: class IV adenylate cyclase [bacterium]